MPPKRLNLKDVRNPTFPDESVAEVCCDCETSDGVDTTLKGVGTGVAKQRSQLNFIDSSYKLGCNINKRETVLETVEFIVKNPELQAMQFFFSGRQHYKITPSSVLIMDLVASRRILNAYDKYAVIHANLSSNLAGSVKLNNDPEFKRKTQSAIKGLRAELDVGAGMKTGVISHIGSCVDKNKGIKVIAENIVKCISGDSDETKWLAREMNVSLIDYKRSRNMLLENSAGEGSKIGSTLQEIEMILSCIEERYRSQINICIDTAHCFGAGQYDFGKKDDTVRFYKDFDDMIGLSKLQVVHFNDSKVPWNKKVDRHLNIGDGYIFDLKDKSRVNALIYFIEEARKKELPLVAEPPSKGNGFIADYNLITKLIPTIQELY